MKALLLENIHPEGVRLLTERGIEVEEVKGALDEAELAAALAGVQLLGIRSKTNVTASVLEASPELQAIGAFCIGTNQVDLSAAAALGIPVFNAPFSNTRSVVELVIAEIIALARHLTDKNARMHAGVWDKSATGAHEVRGRTLGIIGYGNIGSQLSVVAEALGMRVYFYDVADKLALGNARRCETLDELLEVAETVSLHVDGRPGNAGLFGAEQFAMMRRRSLFLNLCRGFVVDHEALREHLLSGHIAGAALDVFAHEPKSAGDPFSTSLQGLPNVILTPHIGGSTEEALAAFLGSKDPAPRTFRFPGAEFEPWQANPNPPTLRTMYAIAQILRAYPHSEVTLIGHTDNVGTPEQNLRLSQERVNRMAQLLIHAGIQPGRITAIGHGMRDPIADNATDEGKARNRRIELVVTAK